MGESDGEDDIQSNFSGSNTDGSFITPISNRCCFPNQYNPIAADIIVFGTISGGFLFYNDNSMLCVFIRIASTKHYNESRRPLLLD